MTAPLDTLEIAAFQQVKLDELELVFQKEKQIPGAWNYQIKRYKRHSFWTNDDFGVFTYQVQPVHAAENFMELKFCIMGNAYCDEKFTDCDQCNIQPSKNGDHKIPTVDWLEFRFDPAHIVQFSKGMKTMSLTDDVLNFRHRTSFARPIQLTARIRTTLESLLNHAYSDVLENIFINAQTQILLLYSLETMLGTKSAELPISCKFLHNEADRDKISRAREILIEHIGDPITIKELSRKVAINECYLKKGFKEMFGTTIFDFYQNQRMEHARFLLYEKGLSVSEVSALLGYSSISHFSTAFKKHTGLKPCELLIRN